MFQNGTLVQNSNLGGTVTYDSGIWWNQSNSWMSDWYGGNCSQGTNIVLELTSNYGGTSLTQMYQCARLQFGPVNTPTFKSVSVSFNYTATQQSSKYAWFCIGTESTLNAVVPSSSPASYDYTKTSYYSGGIGKTISGSKTIDHNIYYSQHMTTPWHKYVDIKAYCEIPKEGRSTVAVFTITKITLNQSTV